jgi:pantothenate kinase
VLVTIFSDGLARALKIKLVLIPKRWFCAPGNTRARLKAAREVQKQAERSRLPWPYDAPGDKRAAAKNGVIGLIRSHFSTITSGQELDTMTSPAARSLTTNSRPIGFAELVRRIAESNGGRQIVAIAGPPGSGKSTLAERLVARLNESAEGSAALLPMDGYHYDDFILIERGLRARKGAPESFDVLGLVHMLDRLQRNQEDEIAVPVFDRDLEISRAGARTIPRAVRALVVEGNYLLLDQEPWSSLRARFDMTVAVDAPEDILRQRLIERWQGYGLPPPEIKAKVEGNYLANGRYVLSKSGPADFVLRS